MEELSKEEIKDIYDASEQFEVWMDGESYVFQKTQDFTEDTPKLTEQQLLELVAKLINKGWSMAMKKGGIDE